MRWKARWECPGIVPSFFSKTHRSEVHDCISRTMPRRPSEYGQSKLSFSYHTSMLQSGSLANAEAAQNGSVSRVEVAIGLSRYRLSFNHQEIIYVPNETSAFAFTTSYERNPGEDPRPQSQGNSLHTQAGNLGYFWTGHPDFCSPLPLPNFRY